MGGTLSHIIFGLKREQGKHGGMVGDVDVTYLVHQCAGAIGGFEIIRQMLKDYGFCHLVS